MKVIETIDGLRQELNQYRTQGRTVGFVPTMGFLHEGHASLISKARSQCDLVVVSIFVNPLQFGPQEDFDRYPRDLQRDAAIADESGADLIFHPPVAQMYPRPILTKVSVEGLTERLCGSSRPGHFDGVATVVLKLLNIVEPHRLYMGLKDFQQIQVVARMIQDLNLTVELVPCPTVREADGLAKSSRNTYLSPEERIAARVIPESLKEIQTKAAVGELHLGRLQDQLIQLLLREPKAKIDYVEILDSQSLQPVQDKAQEVVAAVAVWIGKTRLIDNAVLRAEGREFYAADSNEI